MVPRRICVNLAGYFETKPVNRQLELEFLHIPNITELLAELNQKLDMVIFTSDSVKKQRISIIFNGQRIEPSDLIKQKISSTDIVTVLQPIFGG